MSEEDLPSGFAQRTLERVLEMRSRSPKMQPVLLVVAATGFIALVVISIRHLPPIDFGVHTIVFLLLALCSSFIAIFTNAAEFRFSLRVLGVQQPFHESLRVSILGTAANLLPIPGAAVVRTRALKQLGTGYKSAIAATLAVGVTWVGVALFLSGALLLKRDIVAAICLLAGGIAICIVAYGLLRRETVGDNAGTLYLQLLVLETFAVCVTALSLSLNARVLNIHLGVIDAFALSTASVIASASGLFPGGLGIRELLSGAVAALVGLKASQGVLISALDRVVVYVALLISALIVETHARRKTNGADAPTADTPSIS